MSFAIAISTRNRPESFWYAYKMIKQFSPKGTDIFVVDDCSDTIYFNADYRFKERSGISYVKNMCLQLTESYDAVFLFDDDTYPVSFDWWKPYVESGQHHLCYTFYKPLKIDVESGLKAFRLTNGCMMYFSRHCIETVGGFDTNYPNKFEHIDLTRRIFNNGLTKYKFQDVIGSENLIYCLDQDNAIQRSFTDREMKDNLKAGQDYFNRQAESKAYIEFRS